MNSKNNAKSKISRKNKLETVMDSKEEGNEKDIAQEIRPHPEEPEFSNQQKLENQLTHMEHQVGEYKSQLLRAKAEMENLRKRIEKEKMDIIKYSSKQLIADILPVIDSLIHGLESSASQDPHVKSMRDGMSLTLDLLHKSLEKHGVQIIDPKPSDLFDPTLHEAMSIQKVPDVKLNTIIQVLQKGYQLNGRVLRAARVIVAS